MSGNMYVCVWIMQLSNSISNVNNQGEKIRVLTFPILARTPPQACVMDLFLSIPHHRRASQDTEANHQVASYRV